MRYVLWLSILCCITAGADAQSYYNTDSLLATLTDNESIAAIIHDADSIYYESGLDSSSISPTAFAFAYLEKTMIDRRMIHIKHGRRYRNKQLISVIDFTKKGNKFRFAVIDLESGKAIYHTLVSQGAGKGDKRNDKFTIPSFFSNAVNSETSSLGLIMTRKARQTQNPCHLCKYALSTPHKDILVLKGLEKGINNNIKKRAIVMHTTGSADLSSATEERMLHITDDNYHVAADKCLCYRTGDDGKVRTIAAYASACGIAENGGYIGQSDGCLVLPEEDHMSIMQTLKRTSLVFIYSNIKNNGANYFGDSPVISKIVRYARH